MSEPREGRWLAPPLPVNGPLERQRAFVLGGWKVVLLAGLLLPWGGYEARVLFAFAMGLAYFALSLGFSGRQLAARKPNPRDEALWELPPGAEEFRVEIELRHATSFLGGDRGVLWFDGARFGFNGERTAFLVAASDLIHPSGVVLSDFDAALVPLKLQAGDGKGSLTIRPLVGYGSDYRRRMRAFLRARLPCDEGRQWPPLEPYDEKAPSTLARKTVDEFSPERSSV